MKKIVLGAVATILALAFTWAGMVTYQKRELRARVVEAVTAATRQLDGTRDVAAAEAALQKLRALPARRDPELVEAADPYVAGVLEVLRRQEGVARHRARFVEDREALEAHMARMGARSETWLADAVRLKKRLDEDHYDYQLTATSLGNMLAGLQEARRKVAAQLPAVPLPEEAALSRARDRALAASAAVRQEFEQARKLVGPG